MIAKNVAECRAPLRGLEGLAKVKLGRSQVPTTHTLMDEMRRWNVSTLLSSRSSCFAHMERRLVPQHLMSAGKIDHITRRLPIIGSRRAYNTGFGLSTGLNGKARGSSNTPALTRRTSTSSCTLGTGAGVTYSIRETSPGNDVATISMNNPAKMNIVNSSILGQLTEICQELSQNDSLRVVILTGGRTGDGKAPSFIGGADIKEMLGLPSSQDAKAFINRIHDACQALRNIPAPVIARVHGYSLGAGLEIMAACDLRIATRISAFGMPEVKVGIPSVVEAALLPGLIGMGRTRRLLYLAETISAREAVEWGLIEKMVDDEAALDKTVTEWSERIAAMGRNAIRAQKRLMQEWENSTVDDGIQAGAEAFARVYADGGQEPKELMAKFINRKRG